eukprot:GFUD01006921.1.p1 GENE.GFUD01006921.1~~GFUD01006921.1.p1  ORF type:complete len:382 (-),score=110.62 GFUD01006921.1:88-1233(-)
MPDQAFLVSPKHLPHCQLCSLRMSKFYCVDCVISGQFVHSSNKLCEIFSEKRIRLLSLQTEIIENKNAIESKHENVWKKEKMKEEIELLRAKIQYIKLAIRKNLVKKSSTLELFPRVITLKVIKFPNEEMYVIKASKDRMEADSSVIEAQLEVSKKDLKLAQSRFIQCLQTEIFPLDMFQLTISTSSTNLLLDNMEDAIETSYTSGKWVTRDIHSFSQYKSMSFPISIVEGDNIPLSLACQVTNLVAGVLGRHLPARVSILDLGEVGTSKESLARNVAKLNMNVVSMCMVLGVEYSKMKPGQVFHQMINRFFEIVAGDDQDDDVLASVLGGWENLIDSISVDKEDIETDDSDTEWEKVMTTTDQDWECLDKPSDETWEALG